MGSKRMRTALRLAALAAMAVGAFAAGSALAGGRVTAPPRTVGWQSVSPMPGVNPFERKRSSLCHVSKPAAAKRSPYGNALSPK
jgi:hypothetical protein